MTSSTEQTVSKTDVTDEGRANTFRAMQDLLDRAEKDLDADITVSAAFPASDGIVDIHVEGVASKRGIYAFVERLLALAAA